MKNTKLVKILLASITVVLLLCLAIGVTVSAEGEASPEIISKNAYFGDQTYLYFAVDNSTLTEGDELEVLLYAEDPRVNSEAEVFKAQASTLTYTPNPEFAVFKSFGIPAKAIGDTIYAVPHIVGTEVTYGSLVEYSVLEYLYEMLYTTDLSVEKAELGEALVNYGVKAQKAFGYKTDSLVSSLYYAYISVGTLDGANYSRLYDPDVEAADRTVTLPAVDNVSKWAVRKYAPNGSSTKTVVAAGGTVVIDANTVIEPSYIYDFEESSNVNNYIASGTGTPVRASGTRQYLTVAQDSERGNVLVYNASNNAASAELYFDLTKKLAGANTFAFETDIKLDVVNAAGDKLVHIQPYGLKGPACDIFLQFAEGGAIKIFNQYNDGSTKNESTVTTSAKEGEWFNLRIEYTLTDYNYAPSNGVAKDAYISVYVNGTLATVAYTPYYAADTSKHYTGAEDTLFAFFRNSGDTTAVTAYFDNLLVEQCKTEAPAFADFENGLTPPYVSSSEIVHDDDRNSDVYKVTSLTSGGTDKRIYAIKSESGANAVAFDAYVKFDCGAAQQQNLEFILAGASSIKLVFYGYDTEHTSADFKGTLRVTSAANAGIGLVNNIAPENGWFHLRIEYINKGDKATVNVIVDGVTVATSDAAAVIDPTTVMYVQTNLYKVTDASVASNVYIDDASVVHYVAE